MLAITSVVASAFVSCGGKLREAEMSDLGQAPVQTVEQMFAVQSSKGAVTMRMEAPLMEKYDNDTSSFELFPEGIKVFGYVEDGALESIIVADKAKHLVTKGRKSEEVWSAFGNVVVHNVIKQETMETDTIYWDRSSEEIYTDCYVKMYSPDGFMQGISTTRGSPARRPIWSGTECSRAICMTA